MTSVLGTGMLSFLVSTLSSSATPRSGPVLVESSGPVPLTVRAAAQAIRVNDPILVKVILANNTRFCLTGLVRESYPPAVRAAAVRINNKRSVEVEGGLAP
jgi:hypothetical protein